MRDHQEQREAPEAAEALSSDPPSQSGEIRDNKKHQCNLVKEPTFSHEETQQESVKIGRKSGAINN